MSAHTQSTTSPTPMRLRRVALAGVMACSSMLVLPALASAQYGTPPATVAGNTDTNSPPTPTTDPGATPPPVVRGTSQAQPAARSGSLPLTGGDVAALVGAGVGALAVGGVLVATARKRRSEHYI